MEEMISQAAMALNKLQKKTVRYTEFEQFKESNHHKEYPKFLIQKYYSYVPPRW